MINKCNRAAIYCRLSKDDEQSGDSVSIETQKMMLTNYCAEQNFEIFDIYVDDGYSGLNFNRPSFQRMISDLESGKFDIVVTKDLSRLGRDYIQTGYYTDIYFSIKHIRYIAVNDGIDTLLENNDIAPFKNILNDMYAKDISRKIKSAKHQRAKNGLYISGQPPYGYKVDPDNRNKLIIDEEAAKTVKYIFELVYSGNSYSETSRILEKQQIVCPSAYKVMNGDTRFLKFTTKEQRYKWSYQTVRTIIHNRVYVGDMVNHKFETINYKTKERVGIPIEDQIIVQNTHEPIIDRHVFEIVNAKMSNRRNPNHNYENIFKGLVFCAECGEEMQLIAAKRNRESTPMFRCVKHFEDKEICSKHHFIYYDDLLNEIKNQIELHIEKIINSKLYDELCQIIMQSVYSRARDNEKAKLQKELQLLNKEIRERYKKLSSNMRASELETLYKNQKFLMQKITADSLVYHEISNVDEDSFKNKIKEFLRSPPINRNMLTLFIERIEIGHLEKILSETKQKINLYYRF